MQPSAKHQEYWQKNLFITGILLAIWFVVTFVEGWYARELNSITFLGLLTIFIVSLLTAPPDEKVQALVEHVRYPNLVGDKHVSQAT